MYFFFKGVKVLEGQRERGEWGAEVHTGGLSGSESKKHINVWIMWSQCFKRSRKLHEEGGGVRSGKYL